MALRGHARIHAHRGVPPLARRFKGLASARWRAEHARFAEHAEDAKDTEDLVRAAAGAAVLERRDWLAYHRRLIVTVGAKFAKDGIPKTRRQADESEWGSPDSEFWATYRQRLGDEEWWDPWLKATLRYAERSAARNVREANETTLRLIRREIARGALEGAGVAAVRDRIDALYLDGFTKMRAERVARTEVLTSARAGSYQATIAVGLQDEATKSWQDSGDVLVRDTHSEATATNQGIPYEEPFRVRSPRTGAEQLLLFPGDTSLGADASNVVNCRCDSVTNLRQR